MTETRSIPTPDGPAIDVYLARPDGPVRGAVIVIHEIWGLVDHIRDVADRFAALGYLAAAPDILSRGGIEPSIGAELFAIMNSDDEEARVAAQPRMRDAITGARAPEYAGWAVGALTGVVDLVATEPGVDGRIGVIGFCFGGTFAFLLAAADPRVRAALPFYGSAPGAEQLGRITAPVLALYGQHDPSLIEALPAVEQTAREAGVALETVVYPDAAHAFFNDEGRRYHAASAADAWARVQPFLDAHLDAG